MRSIIFAFLTALLSTSTLFAQEKPSPILLDADAPHWMPLLQADAPNVRTIQQAYNDWYAERPFEKNSYTQYFKRWMHWARPFAQPDGSLRFPTRKESAELEDRLRALRQSEPARQSKLGWRFVGPKRTYHTEDKTKVTWQTNIYAFDIAPSNPNILYAGGETGGLWRTDNKGLSWTLLTAAVRHNSIGAVKIHPTNPDIVYFGTDGRILKTTDGGQNWTQAYAESNLYATDLGIHPDNPEIVLAATDKGLLRSTDDGATWTKLFSNQTWTLKYKPGDAATAFAVRKNGNSSQFMRSSDGGLSWQAVGANWWSPASGETVTGALLAVCPSNPSKIYAYLIGSGANLKGYVGVFVSNDNGDTWTNTHPQNAIGNSPVAYSIPAHTNLMTSNGQFSGFEQGFYDMAIVVNPLNDQELIAGGTSWFKSTDGGATWNALGSYVGGLAWSHPDIQWLAAHGKDLWIASDGGLNYSDNFAQTIEARMDGISGSDMWGFDAGWNEDVLVGGRYHNGNMAWHERQFSGSFLRMGGAESPTGYVNPGDNRKLYFSDIGGKRLNGNLARQVSDFPVGLFPNESYAYYANSEMAWDPRCWNIVYIGKDNGLWKSADGGGSFALLHNFPGNADRKVYDIEIARSNPSVIYCSQWGGVDDAMWRSRDGGETWEQLTALPLPNNNDRVKMAVSAENADVLWVLVTYGSNGKKIYKSENGGESWINLTTPLLDGIRFTNILAQYGTDGGVYIGGDGAVFYRNNSHSDWQPFSRGLPLSAETNRLKPFYRDGKIRNGCWGFGVWEADLYEPSAVIPQAMCSALEVGCARDTVYFNDYSVLRHEGAQWSWLTPGAAYTEGLQTRTPKVVYGAPGDYAAVMRLQTPTGIFFDTLHITVSNRCEGDSVPGQALSLGGNNAPGYVGLPPLQIETNTLTISAWIKPEGTQPEYSAIFMLDGPVAAGLNFRPGLNGLGYHWPGGQWWWNSGLSAPAGKWSHVAMVVTPDSISIYLNGRRATQVFQVAPVLFNQSARLGNYKGWDGRYVQGQIDEVCVYNRSLSQSEIREKMHLRRIPADENALLAYYQFNESDNSPAFDRVATRHGSLAGSAARVESTAPIGPGRSARLTVGGAGTYAFPGVGLSVQFPPNSAYPLGEICATRIQIQPDTAPGAGAANAYWAVHNFGAFSTFGQPAELRFDQLGPITGQPADYRLYRREAVGHGPIWALLDGSAESVTPGPDGSVLFGAGNNVVSFGQFAIETPPNPAHPQASARQPEPELRVRVFPNPAGGAYFTVQTDTAEPCVCYLFDAQGRRLRRVPFEGQTQVAIGDLAPGLYFYRVESKTYMRNGTVVLE